MGMMALSQVLTDYHHWIKPVVAVAPCNVFFLKSLSIFRVAIYDPLT
jgi:hypothetical protein